MAVEVLPRAGTAVHVIRHRRFVVLAVGKPTRGQDAVNRRRVVAAGRRCRAAAAAAAAAEAVRPTAVASGVVSAGGQVDRIVVSRLRRPTVHMSMVRGASGTHSCLRGRGVLRPSLRPTAQDRVVRDRKRHRPVGTDHIVTADGEQRIALSLQARSYPITTILALKHAEQSQRIN